MLFSYWDGLRGARAAPERGEIEPGEIRHILADTFVLEIDPARRAVFRLGGTRLCALFGRELKGEPLHGLWPADAQDEMQHLIDIVVDETAGLVAGIAGETAAGDGLRLELLLLPLRHGGKTACSRHRLAGAGRGAPLDRLPSAHPAQDGLAPGDLAVGPPPAPRNAGGRGGRAAAPARALSRRPAGLAAGAGTTRPRRRPRLALSRY